jgi:hypothetical protein
LIRVTAASACCVIGVSDIVTRSFPLFVSEISTLEDKAPADLTRLAGHAGDELDAGGLGSQRRNGLPPTSTSNWSRGAAALACAVAIADLQGETPMPPWW